MRPRVDAAQHPRFDRGYTGHTGHEHLCAHGLINMNGRLYDPQLQCFLSPDPYVQQPGNSQSYNRYSYCMNNPLMYTDPSGYSWTKWTLKGAISASDWGREHKKEIIVGAAIVGAVALTVLTAGAAPPTLSFAVGFAIGASASYTSQVALNLSDGMSFGDALHKNIDVFDIAVSGMLGGLTCGIGAPGGAVLGNVYKQFLGVIVASAFQASFDYTPSHSPDKDAFRVVGINKTGEEAWDSFKMSVIANTVQIVLFSLPQELQCLSGMANAPLTLLEYGTQSICNFGFVAGFKEFNNSYSQTPMNPSNPRHSPKNPPKKQYYRLNYLKNIKEFGNSSVLENDNSESQDILDFLILNRTN